LKVLHVNASYKPAWIYGGPTVSVSVLCETLAANGIETDIFTTTANGNTELNVIPNKPVFIDGVNVTYFNRITKDHTHFSPRLLLKLWKNVKHYDVVHIHAWWNMVSMLSGFIALKKGVPVVVSPRGMLSSYSFNKQNKGKKAMLHQLMGRSLLSRVNIHVTAQSEKDEIEQIIHPKDFAIIPNLIQLSATADIRPQDNGVFKIIFLSRIDAKKGLDILFDGLKNIKHSWHLTIVGSGDLGYTNSLKNHAQELGITENITWAGFAGEEKFKLLAEHDLFVLPSHNENFGNTVIESLSVGTAVLISKGVGLADHVHQRQLGWVCEATWQSFSDAISNIISNEQAKLKEIRTTAPEIIRHDFSKSTLVKRYIDLYKKVVANERL